MGELVSNALQSRNVALSATLCDPEVTVNVGYNDQKRYAADLSVNTEATALSVSNIEASVACDGLLSQRLVVGAQASAQPTAKEQNFALSAEFTTGDNTVATAVTVTRQMDSTAISAISVTC